MVNEIQKNKSDYNTGKIFIRMLSYTRKYKLLIILYVISSIVLTITSLAFANIINNSIGFAISVKICKYIILIGA